MELIKEQLITLLKKECELYSTIPESEQREKRDKKCFINGLMTGCRVAGISYEELNAVVLAMPVEKRFKDLDEKLSIPTYIRDNIEIKL